MLCGYSGYGSFSVSAMSLSSLGSASSEHYCIKEEFITKTFCFIYGILELMIYSRANQLDEIVCYTIPAILIMKSIT